MTTDELIDTLTTSAAEDPDWLGSPGHMKVMQNYAHNRTTEAALYWLAGDAQSYSVGSEIHIGLPEADSLSETCRLIAGTLIHELSHLDFTDRSGRQAFDNARRLVAGSNYLYNLSETLFQWLEDSRLQVQEVAAHPEHQILIQENYEASVRRLKVTFSASMGGEPLWSKEPKVPASQLWFALGARILTGERGQTAEVVGAVLDVADPIIVAARHADDTNACREAALELTELVAQSMSQLSR